MGVASWLFSVQTRPLTASECPVGELACRETGGHQPLVQVGRMAGGQGATCWPPTALLSSPNAPQGANSDQTA